MDMSDTRTIAAPREVVWAGLNDPDVLRQSIPGCESVEKTSDTEMQAKVTLKIGPVKASFKGNVTLSDIDPPNGYVISGEGSGGAAGHAKGSAVVRLSDAEDGKTLLHYEVKAQVGGKIAQLGGRLIDATAKKLAGEFFDKFSAVVAPPPPEEAPAETADAAADAPAGEKKGWLGGLFKKKGEGKPDDSAT